MNEDGFIVVSKKKSAKKKHLKGNNLDILINQEDLETIPNSLK